MNKFTVGIFDVVILREGDKYGLNNCLTHNNPNPLVEFWDNRYSQFVSRYYADTILESESGLCLDVGNRDVWSVSYEQMILVRNWLKEQLS